jgi:hypothetical protein
MRIMAATRYGTVFGNLFKKRITVTMMAGVECKISMDLTTFEFEFRPTNFVLTNSSRFNFIVDSYESRWNYRVDDCDGSVVYDPDRKIVMSSADALMYFFVVAKKYNNGNS